MFGKMVKFVQNWLYSDKSGCIPAKSFYSGKVVCSGYNGCNRAKWLSSGKSGCIWAGVVVIGQIGCFEQKWLYSGKLSFIRANWFTS